MENGKTTYKLPSLGEIRATAAENLARLPAEYKALTGAPKYPVQLSKALEDLVGDLKTRLTETEISNSRTD